MFALVNFHEHRSLADTVYTNTQLSRNTFETFFFFFFFF